MSKIVFLNGKFILRKEAKISVFDPGFLYAQGAFETMRAYEGKIFAPEKHLDRLKVSLGILKIKQPLLKEKLIQAHKKILSLNNLKNAYVRLTVWQGEEKVNTLIFAREFADYPKRIFKGLIVNSLINEFSPLCRAKSINYAQFYLARCQAEKRGFDEAIFLNSKGFLTEGSRSNIFLVKNNRIFTPCLSCGCLPGITRGIVVSIAQKLNIPLVEKEKILPEELFKADEAFLTSSLMEIMPLTRVNKRLINKAKIGRITTLIQEIFRRKIKNL